MSKNLSKPSSVPEQTLVVSVLDAEPVQITHLLARACLENRCTQGNTRLLRYGEISALLFQVFGSWATLAKLETNLLALAKKHNVQIQFLRSSPLAERPEAMPYLLHISAVYRADILADLCRFFIEHSIELEELVQDVWQAPQTGGDMLSATLTICLPAGTHISWLRESLLDFADALNIDAVLEPWRPSPIPI